MCRHGCREHQHHPTHRDRAHASPKPQHCHQISADLLLAAPLQGTPEISVKALAKVEMPTPNWEAETGPWEHQTSREEEQQHELKLCH